MEKAIEGMNSLILVISCVGRRFWDAGTRLEGSTSITKDEIQPAAPLVKNYDGSMLRDAVRRADAYEHE